MVNYNPRQLSDLPALKKTPLHNTHRAHVKAKHKLKLRPNFTLVAWLAHILKLIEIFNFSRCECWNKVRAPTTKWISVMERKYNLWALRYHADP